MTPPPTYRLCSNCMKLTKFKYQRAISHSRCVECAGSYTISPNDYIDAIFKQANKETKDYFKNKLAEIKRTIKINLRFKNEKM